jgi:hypothetical protein
MAAVIGRPAAPKELENLAPDTWSVNVLAVRPQFRGAGLGTRLLAHADDIATFSNHAEIVLAHANRQSPKSPALPLRRGLIRSVEGRWSPSFERMVHANRAQGLNGPGARMARRQPRRCGRGLAVLGGGFPTRGTWPVTREADGSRAPARPKSAEGRDPDGYPPPQSSRARQYRRNRIRRASSIVRGAPVPAGLSFAQPMSPWVLPPWCKA